MVLFALHLLILQIPFKLTCNHNNSCEKYPCKCPDLKEQLADAEPRIFRSTRHLKIKVLEVQTVSHYLSCCACWKKNLQDLPNHNYVRHPNWHKSENQTLICQFVSHSYHSKVLTSPPERESLEFACIQCASFTQTNFKYNQSKPLFKTNHTPLQWGPRNKVFPLLNHLLHTTILFSLQPCHFVCVLSNIMYSLYVKTSTSARLVCLHIMLYLWCHFWSLTTLDPWVILDKAQNMLDLPLTFCISNSWKLTEKLQHHTNSSLSY